MFSKPTNSNPSARTAPTPAPQPRRPEQSGGFGGQGARSPAPPARVASVLGGDLVFEGAIHGEGELMIDGAVKGDINVGRLIIGEHAHIEGTVRCGAVEVRGRIIGNIEAQQVKLYETAHVDGDITHGQLSIDVGAYFQGRCQQFRAVEPGAPAATVEPDAASHDLAQVIDLDANRG